MGKALIAILVIIFLYVGLHRYEQIQNYEAKVKTYNTIVVLNDSIRNEIAAGKAYYNYLIYKREVIRECNRRNVELDMDAIDLAYEQLKK
jgi:hypothetical protein